MTTTLSALQDWVDQVAKLTQPEDIHWCNGSEAEYKRLINQMCRSGVLIPLNRDNYPNCYLHRSDPSDVARVEHLTFICTGSEADAGPNNHWMSPADAHKKSTLCSRVRCKAARCISFPTAWARSILRTRAWAWK